MERNKVESPGELRDERSTSESAMLSTLNSKTSQLFK
jgi:hypothetical protein